MRTRRALTPVGTIVALLLVVGRAHALPATQPDARYMVDGAVRAIVQVQPPGRNLIWLSGRFQHIMRTKIAPAASVNGLAVLDDVTGGLAPGVHIPIFGRASGDPTVFDMALSPDATVLYVAGTFNSVDGVARKNVAAIDPATGALLPFAPKAQSAKSIVATATTVYVGGVKLASYRLDGTATPGYAPPSAIIDPSLRANATTAAFRDVVTFGSALIAACQCDAVSDTAGIHATKALVQIDGVTGALLPWTPSNLQADSAAFGISTMIRTDPTSGRPAIYLAAGGSDFTVAYDLASGLQIWKTDTSGSSQAITSYQGSIVVGGHFLWSESPTTPQCGKNDAPTPGCYHTPRLMALDPVTGAVLLDPTSGMPWNPGICCVYQGLWALMPDASGTALHVGGEFKKSGGAWTLNSTTGLWEIHGFAKQTFYARFSDPPPPPP